MPTAHFLTVRTSYWTSLNILVGGQYSEIQIEYVWTCFGDRALYREPLPVNRRTDWQAATTENITFPQIRCRAVIITLQQ